MKDIEMITDEKEAILYLANKKRAEDIKKDIENLKAELKQTEEDKRGYNKETIDRLKEYFKK